MRIVDAFRCLLVSLASVGIVLPQITYAAGSASPPIPNVAAPVQDVALDRDGWLRGQLTDPNGTPIAGSAIRLLQSGRIVAETKTDPTGHFALAGIRGGLYEIASDRTVHVCRIWTSNTAPPAAKSRCLLIDDQGVVRGQSGHMGRLLVIGGLIIAAGVIGGVIGYNIKDDDSAS